MAELLTHVLAGYVIGTLLAFRIDWIGPPQVTLVMIGAATPDLTRVGLILDEDLVVATLGIPFDWSPLHYLGGNLIVIMILALLIGREWRRRAVALLLIGAASHHVLDLFLYNVSGYAYPVLWPFTEYHPPAGMLYLSTDRVPTAIAIVIAGAVWYAHRRWATVNEPSTRR